MQELARVIGVVKSVGNKKIVSAQGKEYALDYEGELEEGCVYRIVGTFENDVLRIEHARKLEGFDLQVYEKALHAVEKSI